MYKAGSRLRKFGSICYKGYSLLCYVKCEIFHWYHDKFTLHSVVTKLTCLVVKA